jgi:ABC-type dipeptide/oligopeptide/nickel transport system ATPase component
MVLSFSPCCLVGRLRSLSNQRARAHGAAPLPLLADRRNARTMALDGTDRLISKRNKLRNLPGRKIAMIFQDPVGVFNPAKRIDWHARQVLQQRDPTLGR